MDEIESRDETEISGEVAADLYTTYGMPLEITRDIAQERGIHVDEKGFQQAIEKHRQVSGGGENGETTQTYSVEFYNQVRSDLTAADKLSTDGVVYNPYGDLEFQSQIVAILAGNQSLESAAEGDEVVIILPETHFYLEAGGQVSDTGSIESANGVYRVEDMIRPAAGLIAHKGMIEKGWLELNQPVTAKIDTHRRQDIMRNHTATHLLHAALHEVLGEHARQAGSLVAPDRLRFDFTHREALSPSELERIEAYVNDKIYNNVALDVEHKPLSKAIDEGAIALFGEKYGEVVRTIQMKDAAQFSYELCGGTHVQRTGEIGMFLVTSEGSAAAGIRRIEAITGRKAYERIKNQTEILRDSAHLLSTSSEQLTDKINSLLERLDEFQHENKRLTQRFALSDFETKIETVDKVEDIYVFSGQFDVTDIDTLRTLADKFRAKYPENSIALFAGVSDDKPVLIGMVAENLTRKGFRAGDLVKYAASFIGGGGGGRPTLAQAGGKYPDKIDEALDSLIPWVKSQKEKQKS